ncbi:MAG: Sir2 family NAD-dependent protein deacetylase [Candidatus Omnitrophica bacterium]|nr:Sir2 family NAD-dependent protein deacetylase [Candidatus Omnitrophota bacterium]
MAQKNTPWIKQLRDLVNHHSRLVVFTGAGISTESGISDYRSQGGLWQRFQPVTLQEFLADEDKRRLYWERKKFTMVQMKDAKPNLAHFAIARLERQGKITCVITQNIDGLHQLAGSRNVLEIHGTTREVICFGCQRIESFEPTLKRLEEGEEIPLCLKCGGLLKPNTISFGQNLNPEVLNRSIHHAESCDLMIAVGSTLVVEPAASMPRYAKGSGASLVIINRDPTPLDGIADLVIRENAGLVLDQAVGE